MEFFHFDAIFMKAFIQEHKVLADGTFGPFTFMYVVKIACSMTYFV